MSDWATDRAGGIAALLAAAGLCAWNPDGVYSSDQVAAFVGLMPDEPATALGIMATPIAPTSGVAQLRIQVRVRSGSPDPRDTNNFAQQVVDALHELTGQNLNGQTIPLLQLQSWGDMGRDAAGRPEVSLNFYGYAAYPTPNFRD